MDGLDGGDDRLLILDLDRMDDDSIRRKSGLRQGDGGDQQQAAHGLPSSEA
jgi:hypothetical protein